MSDDAADRFRRENAGKTLRVRFPAEVVEDLKTGDPVGVDPPQEYTFRLDEDGVIVPSWVDEP